MRKLLIAAAKIIWAVTPIAPLRRLYFRIFLSLVRGRKAVVTVDGITFSLDLSEVIDAAIYLGSYERDVRAAIERYCHPGGTAIDIGANVGAHALLLAKKTGPNGYVYAFEPMNYAYRKLEYNISKNAFDNIQAYQIALSNENRNQQELRCRSSWRSDGQSVEETTRVNLRRLDDWCEEKGIRRVDLVKIDVDGNEFAILDGAKKLLQGSRPIIIIEVGEWHFRETARNPFELMSRMGYRFRDARTLKEYTSVAAIQHELARRNNPRSETIDIIAEPDGATNPSETGCTPARSKEGGVDRSRSSGSLVDGASRTDGDVD
jgi:FkbM family methyltransferase